jgi:hypothetical protein
MGIYDKAVNENSHSNRLTILEGGVLPRASERRFDYHRNPN